MAQAAGSAAQAPQTLSSLADQVLATIMPNEENVLQLAGLAAGGATTGRVPGQGQDASELPSQALACSPLFGTQNSELTSEILTGKRATYGHSGSRYTAEQFHPGLGGPALFCNATRDSGFDVN